jgi:phospholipid/cholesterol/gamma-HCH transport system substrate-binding protein
MEYSNELKIGASILAAVVIFFVGYRYLQDLPIFQDSYVMEATFDDASGIVSGNPVTMRGVNVGSVQSVRLDQADQVVRVRFMVNEGVPIPEGSYVDVTGFSALSGVRLSIQPGPSENPPLPPGSTLGPPPGGDVLARLTDQAPAIASKADSVLGNANTAIGALGQQLNNPKSDFRRSIQALNATLSNLQQITGSDEAPLRRTLRNLEAVTADLERFTDTGSDSLAITVDRLNRSLARVETNLDNLERTTQSLDELTTKMNEGDGTIGRLVNDPSLYVRLDSAAARTNQILDDLQRNPGRYLKEMTLMKVF